MTAPERVTFQQRLDALFADVRRTGELREAEYDALLIDSDFDEHAFERFRRQARAAGVALPESDEEPASRCSRILTCCGWRSPRGPGTRTRGGGSSSPTCGWSCTSRAATAGAEFHSST
jgi:hypothetical protein